MLLHEPWSDMAFSTILYVNTPPGILALQRRSAGTARAATKATPSLLVRLHTYMRFCVCSSQSAWICMNLHETPAYKFLFAVEKRERERREKREKRAPCVWGVCACVRVQGERGSFCGVWKGHLNIWLREWLLVVSSLMTTTCEQENRCDINLSSSFWKAKHTFHFWMLSFHTSM